MLFFILQLLFLNTFLFANARGIEVRSYQDVDIIVSNNIASYDVSSYLASGQKAQELIRQKQINGFVPPQKVIARHNGESQIVAVNDIARQTSIKIKQKTLKTQQYYWRNPDFLYRDQFYVIKSDWQTIGGFFNEKWNDVANGYQNVCKVVQNKPDDTPVKSQFLQVGTIGNLKKICMELALMYGKSNDEYQRYFVNNFVPYLVGDDEVHSTKGLFTGYYYPTLNASRVKTVRYKYPIYRKPPELSSQAYYTRKQINDGALNGRGLEIFWVDDFVDLYFLHIQGSGMLKLTDGSYAHVKFAAKNNQRYESLGKYMLEQKYIKKGSDTKAFLQANENIAHDILSVNKSYIFFEENHQKAVIGAHGSELVDGRSLAVDSRYIPYGSMLFVDTKNQSQVMYAQDTGSAIKGKIRGDIFVGKGEEAGEIAKTTHHQGVMYLLVHRDQILSILP